MIAVPSVVGMMLGARIGARLLNVLKGSVIRSMVIARAAVRRAARAAQGHRGVAMNASASPNRRGATARAAALCALLDWGTRVGLLVLVLSFVAYTAGCCRRTCRWSACPSCGPCRWAATCADRSRPPAGAGWRWCSMATSPAWWASPAGRLLGACLLALVPLYLRRGDMAYRRDLCLAEVAVVLLAASGCADGGALNMAAASFSACCWPPSTLSSTPAPRRWPWRWRSRCGLPLGGVLPLVSNPEFEAVAPQLAAQAERRPPPAAAAARPGASAPAWRSTCACAAAPEPYARDRGRSARARQPT